MSCTRSMMLNAPESLCNSTRPNLSVPTSRAILAVAILAVAVLALVSAAASSAAAAQAGSPPSGFPSGAPSETSPWPMALHDAQHSGTSTARGPTSGHIAWTRELGGNITPGPVIGADGSIYAATNAGVLYALDASTGAQLWAFRPGTPLSGTEDLSTSPLVLSSGNVLWPGPDSTLYLLSPQGQAIWKRPFSGSLTSPVRAGSSVYLGTTDGHLISLDARSDAPTVRWILSVGKTSFASPVVAPDGEIITTADNRLIAVRDKRTHGSIAWHHSFFGAVEVSASVGGDGTVVVGTNDPFEYAFTAKGTLRWKVRRNTESYSSPSVSPDGLTYFGGNSGRLQVVHTSSGRRAATDRGLEGLWGAQVIDAHGDVYFGTQGGHVYGFAPDGSRLFDLAASGPIDSYPAMTAGGTLVVGDEHGTLYAIAG